MTGETTPVARETRYDGADGVAVLLPPERAPGIVAVGTMKPGVEYVVSPDEARRLIDVKGFVAVGGKAGGKAKQAPATVADSEG